MSTYAVVIAGGRIKDDFALGFLESVRENGPYLIAADRGLLFFARYGIVPDMAVGDFDSAGEEFARQYLTGHPEVESWFCSWEKDYTDAEIAARKAMEKGCRRIDFLGATGTRVDHVLGNVQLLSFLLDQGAFGRIIDEYNRISLHGEGFRIRKKQQWGRYVSFFAWGREVKGLTLEGFHFPMENGLLTNARTLAVSNQIEEECAEVRFESGRLLMIESGDDPVILPAD